MARTVNSSIPTISERQFASKIDSHLHMQAGGSGSTGKERILDLQPQDLHERIPVFLGSLDDITELESYEDVQQLGSKRYSV